MIYLSRFIDITKKPDENIGIPISVARKAPPWYVNGGGIEYPDLAPVKKDDRIGYADKLNNLDVIYTLNRLLYLAHGKDPILVCESSMQDEVLFDWLTINGFDCDHYIYKKEEKKDECNNNIQ